MFGTQKYGRFGWKALLLVTFLASAIQAWSQTVLPDVPDLIRITVDHSDNGVLIEWEPSEDDDIEFYHLYKMNDEQSFERLFSLSADLLEYKHMTSSLDNLTYSVVAEDSSTNQSRFFDNIQRAVSLSTEFNPCTPNNVLTWTPYLGWEEQISGYKIFGGTDSDSLQMLDFVDFATSSYTHEGISIGNIYYYYIETIHTSGLSSLSAIDSVLAIYPDAPQFITVDYVTVLDENTVELQFTADVSGPVNNFRVMKRSNPGTPYSEVQTFWDETQSSRLIQDEFPTSTISYEYLVQSLFQPPSCAAALVRSVSNTGNSILLANSIENQIVSLSWTPYESYDTELSEYIIQRSTGSGEFYDVQSVGAETTTWSESLQSVVNGSQPGELQYRVLAISNPLAQGGNETSISNITTVSVETTMLVPSAFTPGSNDINSEFKPLLDFAPKDYLMLIMDRGGRKMFETEDPGKGWDGRFQEGDFVNEGVYVFYIQYTDYTGLFRSLTGNVTVLYP